MSTSSCLGRCPIGVIPLRRCVLLPGNTASLVRQARRRCRCAGKDVEGAAVDTPMAPATTPEGASERAERGGR